jgi:hypothetical protein
MRGITLAASLVAVAGLAAGLGWAQAAPKKPVNRKCPLKPDVIIDPTQVVVHNGKAIGLCCSDCTEKFKKNPAAYMAAVKEDSHLPKEPDGYTDFPAALDAAKGGGYLLVVLFADKKGQAPLLRAVSDPSLESEFASCAYVKVEYVKDSPAATALDVKAVGTLVFVDPRGEKPKVIKSMTSGAPPAILKEIQNARKEMEK